MARLTSADDLARAGLVPAGNLPGLRAVAERYAVAVTPAVARRIAAGSEGVALQFLPSPDELTAAGDELSDPIGDHAHSPVPGIVHRYPDRLLLQPTTTCPVYCRYCFRRETVGRPDAGLLGRDELTAALDYIHGQPQVWEVILSGGDPLILSPRRLGRIAAGLATAGHVRILRVHSRVPVAAPERITPDLVAALRSARQTVWLVLHVNHPDELDDAALAACARLADAGIPLMSQSVLLRGVNDDAATLEHLFRRLVEHRVRPYYLHHCDLAPGTARFRTGIEAGQALMQELRGRVSGLCQPAYVLDIPGGAGKSPLGPSWITRDEGTAEWRVRDYRGGVHRYPADPED
ncbi:MAG: lysine-2,3-aminomutase-like protein [Gammaproteobacteria bacterium]|nr:lysine-2,3-aminomutase-like protein [Gammaproteobacteria bacterium]